MKKYEKNTLIEDLDISFRSKNALHKANIVTVKDLLNYDKKKLYTIKNLGKKSVEELLKIINSFVALCVRIVVVMIKNMYNMITIIIWGG